MDVRAFFGGLDSSDEERNNLPTADVTMESRSEGRCAVINGWIARKRRMSGAAFLRLLSSLQA